MNFARVALIVSAAFSAASLAAAIGQPQPAKGPAFAWPDRLQNARVLPADIGPDRLRDTMRHFAISLGVRCTYCHVGPENAPLTELDFVSDANPRKEAARGMMRMMANLNDTALPAVPNLHHPRVSCFTCHRGSATPETEPPPPTAQPANRSGGQPSS